MIVCDTRDSLVPGRKTHSTRIAVAEIARHRTPIVIATLDTIIEFRGCQVTVIVGGAVFITEESLLPMNVWIEVAMMLGIAMTESGG